MLWNASWTSFFGDLRKMETASQLVIGHFEPLSTIFCCAHTTKTPRRPRNSMTSNKHSNALFRSRDGIDPEVAHKAFLVIPEYRQAIDSDLFGATYLNDEGTEQLLRGHRRFSRANLEATR